MLQQWPKEGNYFTGSNQLEIFSASASPLNSISLPLYLSLSTLPVRAFLDSPSLPPEFWPGTCELLLPLLLLPLPDPASPTRVGAGVVFLGERGACGLHPNT